MINKICIDGTAVENLQIRDKHKTLFAKKNNFKLIRIWVSDLTCETTIKEVLNEIQVAKNRNNNK